MILRSQMPDYRNCEGNDLISIGYTLGYGAEHCSARANRGPRDSTIPFYREKFPKIRKYLDSESYRIPPPTILY